MRTLLAAVAALLLTGCALSPPSFFVKDGESAQDLFRDKYQCKHDTYVLDVNECTWINMYTSCMVVKGYTPIPKTGNANYCVPSELKKQIYPGWR